MRTLLLSVAVALAADSTAKAADLQLVFSRVGEASRVVYQVYRCERDWAARRPTVSGAVAPKSGRAVAKLELPPGVYAVMAFEDRNDNGRLDTLPIGLPVEPYGFSNNSRGMFGPPRWATAHFRLSEPGLRQEIRLR